MGRASPSGQLACTYPKPKPRMVKKAMRGGTKPRRATYCTLRPSLMQKGMGLLKPKRLTMMAIGWREKAPIAART